MKNTLPYILCLILICFFIKSSAGHEIEQEHLNIRGKIIDSLGKEVVNASVNILKGQDIIIETTTDSLGRFVLTIPDTGKYIIEFLQTCKSEITFSEFSHDNIKHQTINKCNSIEIQYDIVIIVELPPVYEHRPIYKGLGDINKILTYDEIEKGAY